MSRFWGLTDDVSLSGRKDKMPPKKHEVTFDRFASHAPVHFKLSSRRVILFSLVLIFFLFLLLTRTAYLQLVRGEYYQSMAEGNRTRIEHIPAIRGGLYDRTGKQLVKNIPSFTDVAIRGDLPRDEGEKRAVFEKLSALLHIDAQELLETVDNAPVSNFEDIPLKNKIPYDNALPILLAIEDIPGIATRESFYRSYPYGEAFSHLLGYVGVMNQSDWELYRAKDYRYSDRIGKTGLEKQYEQQLRGVDGRQKVEVNAVGKPLDVIDTIPPQRGDDLTLSISIDLQEKMYSVLENILDDIGQDKAAAIALDPRNGEMLAMVSLPSFDNNNFIQGLTSAQYSALSDDPSVPLFNRASSGEYPSGSTIKPIIAAAALEEDIVSPSYSVYSSGGLEIGAWYFPDWQAGGHGRTNLRKALAESVNTYFYLIGGGDNDSFQGLGVDMMKEYSRKFGLSYITGLDFPGEADGFLPSPEWKEEAKGERWYLGDTYHFAIGQGDVLVTPLQISSAFSVFANRGTLYTPHFLRQQNQDRKEGVVVNDQVVSKETINAVRAGLRDTVIYGSARSLGVLPISSAGKTGTSQFSSLKDPHAWFSVFAPYENPEIVLTILIEEGETSNVSVRAAREILEWWAEHRS